MDYYYGTIRAAGGWCGVVYHWAANGNQKINDHLTKVMDTPEQATDAAAQWCANNDIEAELE